MQEYLVGIFCKINSTAEIWRVKNEKVTILLPSHQIQ